MITFPAGSCMTIPLSATLSAQFVIHERHQEPRTQNRELRTEHERSIFVNLQSAMVLRINRQARQMIYSGRFAEFAEETRKIERLPAEYDRAIFSWPLTPGSIPCQLEPIEIRIVQV